MGGPGVWTGLASSAFLAGVDDRDRDPLRFGATLVGGLVVGLALATISFIVVLVTYAFATGHGAEGWAAFGHILGSLNASQPLDLSLALLNLAVAATNAPLALAFVAVAAVLARHSIMDYVSVARRVRWRLLVAGLVLSTLVFSPLMAAQVLFSSDAPPMPILTVSAEPLGRGAYLVAVVALLIPAAAAEELMFRGWLLRQTAALLRQPAPLIAFTAILFAAIHLDFSPDAFLTRALMGAGFAYMTLRLGGIEFATGVHASNNILIVLFVEPLTSQTINGPSNLSVSSLVVDVAMVAAYILITEAVARLPLLRRWAGVSVDELSGAGGAAAHFT